MSPWWRRWGPAASKIARGFQAYAVRLRKWWRGGDRLLALEPSSSRPLIWECWLKCASATSNSTKIRLPPSPKPTPRSLRKMLKPRSCRDNYRKWRSHSALGSPRILRLPKMPFSTIKEPALVCNFSLETPAVVPHGRLYPSMLFRFRRTRLGRSSTQCASRVLTSMGMNVFPGERVPINIGFDIGMPSLNDMWNRNPTMKPAFYPFVVACII